MTEVVQKQPMLQISIHRSRLNKSEVARVDINTEDIKRAVIVHYLSSVGTIVVDLMREDDVLYDRLARIDLLDIKNAD